MNTDVITSVWVRLQGGDHAALQTIFASHYQLVWQTVLRMVQDASLADDLAQNVFVRLWEKRNSIQINTSPPAYLKRMAINEALMHLRKQKNWQLEELDVPHQESDSQVRSDHSVQYQQLEDAVQAAIQSLPERCRLVFHLSRYEELSYAEIAREMDISIKTVEHQMGKALKVMREKLQPFLSLLLFYWIS